MSDGARCDPRIVEGNPPAASLALRNQATVRTGNLMVVGNDDEVPQGRFERLSSSLTPVCFLGSKIEFADRDEGDGQQPALNVRCVHLGEPTAFHQV